MYSFGNSAILIIDDNIVDQLILEEEIKRTTLPITEVAIVTTVAMAKSLLQEKHFALIFLELFLPDSHGIKSFIELQKIDNTAPIIIFSNVKHKDMALNAISLGAQDFLIKGDHTIEMLEKTMMYSMERKKNLEIIKANNERHETLLKVTNDILWDWDMLTDQVAWSGNAITKYIPDNTYGDKIPARFWLKGMHHDDRKNVLADISAAIASEQKFWKGEYRFLRNDGQYDDIYSRGYILRNANNKPVRMIGSMQDISEKKQADNKLAYSEKRFKSLTQNSSDLIYLLDKEGNFLYSSDSILNVLGYDPKFLINKNLFDFIHPEDVAKGKIAFIQVFTSNFIEAPPFRFKNAFNKWQWLQSTLINMLNEVALGGIIVNSRDITTRVQAEEQLLQTTLRRQKEVTEAMIEGQEKERSEIGRELHDNINQLLVASKLYIERGMLFENGSHDLLSNAITYLKDAIEEIRKLSKTLITPPIRELGLIESVESLVEDIMRVNSIQINLIKDGFTQHVLNEKFKLNIFRIVQEQVNNILKHANASQVDILFKQSRKNIFISINDDGDGFNTYERKQGVGISNIYSRAAMYKGNVIITSSPGNGCNMSIVFNEANLTSGDMAGVLER